MNQMIITGIVASDITEGNTENGTYARCQVAVRREFRDTSDFFSVVAFGKLGNHLAKHWYKGKAIMVRGRMEVNQLSEKRIYNIVAENIEFMQDTRHKDNEVHYDALPPEDRPFC